MLEQPASLVLGCLLLPVASHFFVIGVPRCCALSASCLCGPSSFCSNLLLNSHLKRWNRTSILDGLYTEMLSILTAHSLGPRQHSHWCRQPGWWDADCLHGMVPSRTTTGCVLKSLTHGSAQHGNSSIAQSVQPDGISGLSSKIHVLFFFSSQSTLSHR